MKIYFAILVASVAVTSADQCDLAKLQPLLTNPAVQTCAQQSGYNLVPPTRPTDEQLAKICVSDACEQVLSAVAAMGLPDCQIGTVSIKTDLLERVATGCAALAGGATTAPSTTTPAPTTVAPSTATVTPGATTKAPNATTPAPTTARPTSKTPVPSANTTATTAPTRQPNQTVDSSSEEEPTEMPEGSESGSDDTSIGSIAMPSDETPAPTTKRPATPAPTTKTSNAVVLAATTVVSLASIASAVLL